MLRTTTLISALVATFALTACGETARQPQPASLNRTVNMIGADGKNYGKVEFDPIKGGTIYDTQGRIIGYVQQPAR
jgi:hypothetical protein